MLRLGVQALICLETVIRSLVGFYVWLLEYLQWGKRVCFELTLICACVHSIAIVPNSDWYWIAHLIFVFTLVFLYHDWGSDAFKQATAAQIGLTHSSKPVA